MISSSEQQRLRALHKLNILDTPRSASFDALIDLVARICEVPIAAISLVDEKRQWFKAFKGLDVRETPRDVAFCSHTIESDSPLLVSNALTDARFSNNPLVTDAPYIRFYMGFPLELKTGERIGSLCVIDRKTRTLTELQKLTLSVMSKHITELIGFESEERRRIAAEQTLELQKLSVAATSKMSSLGEMASGIAHEINNPLGAIVARSGLLIELAEQSNANQSDILIAAQAIESIALRISKTVRALRAFARDGEDDPIEPSSVKEIFTDTLELCAERFRHAGVKLSIQYPEANLMVSCRPTQITQVLLNLLNNAFDATLVLEERIVTLAFSNSEGFCELSVSNNGPSIPREIRSRIMEPFFTTKPAGKGTGLGLSISQRILHGHQSILELADQEEGVCFKFKLPIASPHLTKQSKIVS